MPSAPSSLNIAVAMGGISAEREVSLVTGRAVAKALSQAGHRVAAIDLKRASIAPILNLAPAPDVVFVALHGPYGEDGTIQRELEDAGLNYTGSGVKASQLAMDKELSKIIFMRGGIPTAQSVVVQLDDDHWHGVLGTAIERFGVPLVLKPVADGSSVGVTIARTVRQAVNAVMDAKGTFSRLMIEQFLRGREFTLSVLDGVAMPLVEIQPAAEFYDYTAKYHSGGTTQYIVDPSLPQTTRHALIQAGLSAYRALDCRGGARADLILTAQGPMVLEVNTIPGMTPTSLLPMAAAAAGLDFAQLCDVLCRSALHAARLAA